MARLRFQLQVAGCMQIWERRVLLAGASPGHRACRASRLRGSNHSHSASMELQPPKAPYQMWFANPSSIMEVDPLGGALSQHWEHGFKPLSQT